MYLQNTFFIVLVFINQTIPCKYFVWDSRSHAAFCRHHSSRLPSSWEQLERNAFVVPGTNYLPLPHNHLTIVTMASKIMPQVCKTNQLTILWLSPVWRSFPFAILFVQLPYCSSSTVVKFKWWVFQCTWYISPTFIDTEIQMKVQVHVIIW